MNDLWSRASTMLKKGLREFGSTSSPDPPFSTEVDEIAAVTDFASEEHRQLE